MLILKISNIQRSKLWIN